MDAPHPSPKTAGDSPSHSPLPPRNRFCDLSSGEDVAIDLFVQWRRRGTAWEERFRTLTTAYYRGAQGIVLVYDVTNLDSFNHLSYWLRNIEENASPEVVKVLAGNKCEVSSQQRAVDKERGQKLAESFDMPFYEVSCRGDVNVQDTFLTLARLIRDLRQRRIQQ
ncbi:ras-related protein Rab-8A-like [Penaeus japonicus]|uniref:ras-related protein Rab-8A-like n=1 Tax=Penaeus japonicus TaxID=27405 RepID=UPI001C71081D|nr:ras-related protein Rab-8A-like [Penaeus japonicus]